MSEKTASFKKGLFDLFSKSLTMGQLIPISNSKLPEISTIKNFSMFVKYVNKDSIKNDYISKFMQLNSDILSHNTRIRNNFSVPYFSLSASKSCFIYQRIICLKSVPQILKQKKNSNKFLPSREKNTWLLKIELHLVCLIQSSSINVSITGLIWLTCRFHRLQFHYDRIHVCRSNRS